jgi:hypothetical protein
LNARSFVSNGAHARCFHAGVRMFALARRGFNLPLESDLHLRSGFDISNVQALTLL